MIFKGLAENSFNPALLRIDFKFFSLGLMALLIVWLSKAFRIYVITRGVGQNIALGHCLQIYLATCFVSHVTPFSAGGTPLQIYLLHKEGLSLGKATAITTIDLGLHSIVYLLILIGTISRNIGFFKQRIYFTPGLIWKGVTVIVLLAVTIGILYFWYRLRWADKIVRLLVNKGWLKRLRREIMLFKEGSLLLIKANWQGMLKAIFASITYWFFYLLLAPLILLAMGKPIEFFSLMYNQLIFNVLQPFIPTPGGSGGAELLLSYLFRETTGAQGLGLFVLLWRIYTFYSSLAIGGFFFWRLTR